MFRDSSRCRPRKILASRVARANSRQLHRRIGPYAPTTSSTSELVVKYRAPTVCLSARYHRSRVRSTRVVNRLETFGFTRVTRISGKKKCLPSSLINDQPTQTISMMFLTRDGRQDVTRRSTKIVTYSDRSRCLREILGEVTDSAHVRTFLRVKITAIRLCDRSSSNAEPRIRF